jgi:hypothetical protein
VNGSIFGFVSDSKTSRNLVSVSFQMQNFVVKSAKAGLREQEARRTEIPRAERRRCMGKYIK